EPRTLEKDIRHYLDYGTSFEKNALSENEKTLFFWKEGKLCVKEATKLGYKVVEEFDTVNVEFPNSKTRRGRVGKKVCPTLTTHPRIAVYYHGKLRMLTALEHWRLMGFDDADYWRIAENGLTDIQISALAGNSICVPVMEAIFKNLPMIQEYLK
ncbi:MAG: DNA cytosine methyltransferase, partial [Finegoldia sp.]